MACHSTCWITPIACGHSCWPRQQTTQWSLIRICRSIGNPSDFREVSKDIIVESFPPKTPVTLYQPLLDSIPSCNGPVLREALTSMAQANAHRRINAITAPTLVMIGAKDDVATPAITRGIQAQITGAQLVEFNSGHFMMTEDPERFRTALREFLQSLRK